jgi:glutamate-ammonia-ligase adenylyltransferase
MKATGRNRSPHRMYFMRLTQRLMAALTAPTAEGMLYEVDFRLRPSGNKGPLATSFRGFSKYQRNEAWTWEHQALCRARTVAGDTGLREKTEAELQEILALPRDEAKLKDDIVSMRRAFSRRSRPAARGISSSPKAGLWTLISLRNFLVLSGLPNGNLNGRDAAHIFHRPAMPGLAKTGKRYSIRAFSEYSAIMQMVRLCTEKGFDPDTAPKGLIDRLCAGGFPDLETMQAHLVETEEEVAEIFRSLLGDPLPNREGSAERDVCRIGVTNDAKDDMI